MEENKRPVLKDERDRRKRVARMRTAIITIISVWIVLSIAIITMLCIKVLSLQNQIDVLSGKETEDTEVSTEDANASSLEIVLQTEEDEDNLVGDDDIHKVYLTFDDGPSENTDAILDILDDYGVKATFFVVGKEDETSIAAYQRIVSEGHTIGMHSYSHVYSDIYSSLDAFEADFSKIQNLIYDVTGVESIYYRFPGGSSNRVSNSNMAEYIQYLNDQNITYFDWNVSSGDATTQAFTADELVENVMADVVKYKTSVVLLHDATNKEATVEALPAMIEALQASGALLLPIDENTDVIQHASIQQ